MTNLEVKQHNNKVFKKYSNLVQKNIAREVEHLSEYIEDKLTTEIRNGGWWVYDHDRKGKAVFMPHSIDKWDITPVIKTNSDKVSIRMRNNATNPYSGKEYIKYLIASPFNAGEKSGLTASKWKDIRQTMSNKLRWGIERALFARKEIK